MYFTVPPNGVAELHFGARFQALGLPNQTRRGRVYNGRGRLGRRFLRRAPGPAASALCCQTGDPCRRPWKPLHTPHAGKVRVVEGARQILPLCCEVRGATPLCWWSSMR